jgi:hypothetical protein
MKPFRQNNQVFRSIFLGLFVAALLCTGSPLSAQTNTRGENSNEDHSRTGTVKKKVLIIPSDPKMYMSDIDRSISRETNQSFKEIRDLFRTGLDNQLVSAFKNSYTVITLLRDTVKSKADLQFIYHSTGYKYTVTQGKEKTAEQKPVSNGQLTVPIKDEEERYMRTVINQPGLLEAMNKKYGAELFVFISEIDLKAAVSTDPNPLREAWIHFTIYDLEGKQVGGGLAKVKFDPGLNDPKKIVSRYFSEAARMIYSRSIPPPPVKTTPGSGKAAGK